MLNCLKKVDKAVVKLTEWLLILFILTMTLMAAWQVVCRYVLMISTSYAEEFARLSVVWCIFLGGALAVRKNEHMCVEALYDVLPDAVKHLCDIITYILLILFGFVMLVYGTKYSIKTSGNHQTSLGYSMCVFYIPCAISGLQIIIYSLCNMIMSIYNKATGKNVHFE